MMQRLQQWWMVAFLSLMLVLGGCALASGPEPEQASEPAPETAPRLVVETPTVVPSPSPPEPAGEIGAAVVDFAAVREQARAHLADQVGLPVESVEVIEAHPVDLPAGELACSPRDGAGVTGEAETRTGEEIFLQVAAYLYVYYSDGSDFVMCEDFITDMRDEATAEDRGESRSLDPIAGGAPSDEVQHLLDQAREDLSQRTGVAPEDIEVVEVEGVMWSDASLGCPEPGMMYAQVITPGYRIVLKADDQLFSYHTDERHARLCEQERSGGSVEIGN